MTTAYEDLNAEILESIRHKVQLNDLETTTIKDLRESLQKEMNVDLSPYKSAITMAIKESLQTIQRGQEELSASGCSGDAFSNSSEAYGTGDAGDNDDTGKNRIRKSPSPPSSSGIGVDLIGGKDAQEEQDRLMAIQLQQGEGRHSLRRKRPVAVPAKRPNHRKTSSSLSSKKKSNFPEYTASEHLKPLLDGREKATSAQAIQAIWTHIKKNDLQDPSDRRYVLCDQSLETVFKRPRIHMFQMAKSLRDHLFRPDETE